MRKRRARESRDNHRALLTFSRGLSLTTPTLHIFLRMQRNNVAGLFRRKAFLGAEPQGKIIPSIPIPILRGLEARNEEGQMPNEAKTEIPFLGLSLLRNQSETLIPPAMQDRNSASFQRASAG